LRISAGIELLNEALADRPQVIFGKLLRPEDVAEVIKARVSLVEQRLPLWVFDQPSQE